MLFLPNQPILDNLYSILLTYSIEPDEVRKMRHLIRIGIVCNIAWGFSLFVLVIILKVASE